MARLEREFFSHATLQVAREMLGKRLVRLDAGLRLAGYIVETEAYVGEDDLGCHAKAGRTPRTLPMYGPPGCLYVYFTYGMHWMLNFVTEQVDFPAAVLIRAIFPTQGIAAIARRRAPQPRRTWTDGPAKICQALSVDAHLNKIDACDPQSPLFLEEGVQIPDSGVTIGARVGLYSVPEPWKSKPWRFKVLSLPDVLRQQCTISAKAAPPGGAASPSRF